MDRSSFLSCLPFLSSETFASWPPTTACGKSHVFEGNHVEGSPLTLEHYTLSIEPRGSNAEETTLGPACFSTPATVKPILDGAHEDSSICQFQMTVVLPVNQNKPSSPAGSVSTNGTSTTTSQSPKTPLRTANADIAFRRSNVAAAKVFVRIDDKHCFRMDMRQLEKMELQVPDTNTNRDAKQEAATAQKPPCLLLVFPTCCFRIFSLKEDVNSSHKELESVYHRLQACWESLSFHREGMVGGMFPNDWTNSFGASSSSSGGHGTSSNEAGQRHATTATTAGITAAASAQDNQTLVVQGQSHDGKAVSSILRQRQKCFAKSRDGLKSLNTVLDMPAWIWEAADPKRRRILPEGQDDHDNKDEANVLRDHLSDSLCSTADHLSASFWVNRSEKNQVAQFYETKLQEQEDEMEQLLTEAFPRTLRGRFPASSPDTAASKRHRKTAAAAASPPGCSAPSPAQQPGTPAVTQDAGPASRRQLLLQAKETMKRQRQAIVGRHKLSLLPSRW